MKSLLIFLTIFYLMYGNVGSLEIECNAPALEWNDNILEKLQRGIFWSMFIIAPDKSYLKAFQTAGRNVSTGYVFSNGKEEVTIISMYPYSPVKYHYRMDSDKVIFGEWQGPNNTDGFKFALSYIDLNTNTLIFVSCDRSYAWAQTGFHSQIELIALKNLCRSMRSRASPYFIDYKSNQ